MRGQRIVWVGLLGMIALVSGVGCDQLPWAGKPKGPSSTQAAQTAALLVPVVPPSEQVALVNQRPISLHDVELAVKEVKQVRLAYGQAWTPLPATASDTALDLPDLLTNLVDAELKAQDARSRGLDRKTDVQRRLSYLERNFYAQEWDRLQREQAAPADEEIHKFYEERKAYFVDPERIRVRMIVAKSGEDAEAARSRAVQGTPFDQLAAEVSIGADKDQQGAGRWFLRQADKDLLMRMGATPAEDVLFPQLEAVAFALDPNQISQPAKGPDGRSYLVQLVERKPQEQLSELKVHDGIKEMLTLQHMARQLQQLRDTAQGKIQEFPERLAIVEQ